MTWTEIILLTIVGLAGAANCIGWFTATRWRTKCWRAERDARLARDLEQLAQDTATHYRRLYMRKCGIPVSDIERAIQSDGWPETIEEKGA